MLDLVLAIAHHILIFGLFGILATEFMLVRRGMDQAMVSRVAATDLWYGLSAALIIVIGFSRAIFAAKGWDYYSHNLFFWAKFGIFAVIGALSAAPTIAFLRWRREKYVPDDARVAGVRHFLWAQVMLFPLLLIFTTTMARGFEEFSAG
jgi:putative membrane protein